MISSELLRIFSHFIQNKMGLYFPEKKWPDLENRIKSAAKALNFKDELSLIQFVMSSSMNNKHIEILTNFLTIGETYFFRDNFKILAEKIFIPIINKRYKNKEKYLRIWSAGCATGEEPLSIAILLNQLIPDIKNWNITLLATDINIQSLQKLSQGIYSTWSFRGVSEEIKKNYFHQMKNNQYEILPKIKELVTAFYHNLAQDPYPSLNNNTNAMDIIFCRNVLMYFSPQLSKKIINKFYACLVNNGYLLVSSNEVFQSYFSKYQIKIIDGHTFFRKKMLKKTKNKLSINDLSEVNTSQQIHKPLETSKISSYQELIQQYANGGQLNKALYFNEKALANDKINVNLHYMRAMIMLEMNNIDECITELHRVIYLDPHCVPAYIFLGNLFKKKKKFDESNKYFDNAYNILCHLNPDEIIGEMPAVKLMEMLTLLRKATKKNIDKFRNKAF